jgi:ubiquinone/menaquinone biosynthesis C-methylase UbiE
MENLPLPDASLDAVMCIYCFHEMPESARAAAAKEWFRWGFCAPLGEGCVCVCSATGGGIMVVYCFCKMLELAHAAAAKE